MSRNPFYPTFGRSPSVVAGRDQYLHNFRFSLLEGGGNPWRTALISGTRGIGKTVLLNELESIAQREGWIVLRAHVGDGMISDLRDSAIPRSVNSLDFSTPTEKRTITDVGVSSLSLSVSTTSTRTAPTSSLLSQLQDLSALIRPQGTGIMISVDEIQSAQPEHIRELAIAVQDLNRDDADIAFVAAGLPSGIEDLLQLDGTTFLRRAEKVHLETLSHHSAVELFIDTAQSEDKIFDREAAELAASYSFGYPYLIQVMGSISWTFARAEKAESINIEHVRSAIPEAIERMGSQVHAPFLHKVPEQQMRFLYSMAELSQKYQESSEEKYSPRPIAIRDIAARLATTTSALSRPRQALIYRELIRPHSHGYLDFSLPFMADYLMSLSR